MAVVAPRGLRPLARLYGIETSYRDVSGRMQKSSPEALLLVLRAVGAPIETIADVPGAIRERRLSLWERELQPVVVAWQGRPTRVELRLPVELTGEFAAVQVETEDGEAKSWSFDLAEAPTRDRRRLDGRAHVSKTVTLPQLPAGYQRLTVEVADRLCHASLIVAPPRAYQEAPAPDGAWGVFAPLYALHDEASWGAGDLSTLSSLIQWTSGLGGRVVGTLPLLPAFLGEPFEPSPYSPASRLFWNEFYVDIKQVSELAASPAARAIIASEGFQTEVEELRSLPLVDYRRQMALKRMVLEELAASFFTGSPRYGDFRRFLEARPAVEDYARFRAVVERRQTPWPEWPSRLRDGVLTSADYDSEPVRYHLFVQWLMHEQLGELSRKAAASGSSLYLDLPLGVHYNSYDVWRERDSFVLDVSGGAPPDTFFTKGQDWGFPPLHPEATRESGHSYFIACIRHHLEKAGFLRIDHVMGLHRLFWVPKGLPARDGVYVRYPAEELYAILCLESQRHKAEIVGENLGTVPPYVNPTMKRHGIRGMYVGQYQLSGDVSTGLSAATAGSVASLNTHDMPPFASFCEGLDIEDRSDLGLLKPEDVPGEREGRRRLVDALAQALARDGWLEDNRTEAFAMLKAALAFLSASPSRLVLVNLEDLWLETLPQNVPGTWRERPNWRRRARYGLESLRKMPQVVEALREVDRRRREERAAR